jgi:hypothetical protein
VLWSNVETLKPFLYSATPKPVVSQRGDETDPIGRVAAQVLERALIFTMAEDHFGTSLRNARDDYLLPGRGQVWARYVPEFKPAEKQVSETNSDDQPEGLATPTRLSRSRRPSLITSTGRTSATISPAHGKRSMLSGAGSGSTRKR